MMTLCPNEDCRPQCGNDMAQALLEAMSKPVQELLLCPLCGTKLVVASRIEF